ncbi:hypothetical protein ASE04_18360 [Rhizobium sp. Root708]|nr:hypothetical protein ASE04_18360 [Rhizobium sp. Root708]
MAQSGLERALTALETSQQQLAQTELHASADRMIIGVSVESARSHSRRNWPARRRRTTDEMLDADHSAT